MLACAYVKSETYRVVHVVDFILCDSNVGLSDLNIGVVEYLVKKNEAFRTVTIRVVHISAKSFSECVRGKMVDVEPVFEFEQFELLVDVLDCHWITGTARLENIQRFVRTAHKVPKFFELVTH